MGKACSEFRRTKETNEELIQARVDRIFSEMGSHFTFGPTTEDDERRYRMERMNAAALSTTDIALDHHTEDGPVLHDTIKRCGHWTKMVFAQHFIHLLEHLQGNNKSHSLDMLNLQFQLARIICHESIHAIELARSWETRNLEIEDKKQGKPFYPHWSYEPYYEDHPLSELGIAWERDIFGCALTGGFTPWSPHSYFIDGSEWSSGIVDFSVWEVYLQGYPKNPQRGNLDFYNIFSILPMAYIHQIQQPSFWMELEDRKKRPGSLFEEIPDLRIPEMIGIPDEHQ
ncbi:vacuolar amino acid transporter 3 [Physcia stellaris]|nr:vacuolar amino acid transporter 3 [Physcia stellaris]